MNILKEAEDLELAHSHCVCLAAAVAESKLCMILPQISTHSTVFFYKEE